MKLRIRSFTSIVRAVSLATIVGYAQFSHGGWTGGQNGAGYGWAGVNVTSSTLVNRGARTGNISGPSAAMAPFNYKTNAPLPSGSSPNTVARVKGSAGYIWQATTTGSNGDKTDNKEIEQRVAIKPAACTLLTMDSALNSFDPQNGIGSLKVSAMGTAGTALLLQGFEVEDVNDVPEDDPNTPQDESREYVKLHGVLKFESLMVGPFEYGSNGKCELLIYFALEGDNLDNFIFTSDGLANGAPIAVTCPESMTVQCGDSFVYPAVEVNTCRNVTLDYSPAENELELGENTVTVTATDDLGDTATCTFIVTVVDNKAPVAPTLPDVTGECGSGVTLTRPTATDACSGEIVTGTTTTTFPITQPGTTTVTWSFTDSQNNTSTANQKVIINGYTFVGFYSPIGAVGGSCSSIAKEIKQGSNVPIKFDFKCGSSFVNSGPAPVIKIQRWSNSCQFLSEPLSIPAVYQNDWHNNWDTTGWAKGIYKVIAVLPDGTSHFVFVRLK